MERFGTDGGHFTRTKGLLFLICVLDYLIKEVQNLNTYTYYILISHKLKYSRLIISYNIFVYRAKKHTFYLT